MKLNLSLDVGTILFLHYVLGLLIEGKRVDEADVTDILNIRDTIRKTVDSYDKSCEIIQ